MPKPKRYDTSLMIRFAEAMLARIRAVLVGRESIAGFIREAVERELQRREGPSRPTPRRKA